MAELRERLVSAIEAEWLRRAEAKTVGSPRQHSEAMADVVLAVLKEED